MAVDVADVYDLDAFIGEEVFEVGDALITAADEGVSDASAEGGGGKDGGGEAGG